MSKVEDLKSFDLMLREQILRNWKNYYPKRIDLSVARDKAQFDIAGKYICVQKISSNSAAATIILNDKENGEIDLVDGIEIDTLFQKVFITNTAQSSQYIDLIFGANFRYRKSRRVVLGNNEIQVYWAGAFTKTIAPAQYGLSDVFTFSVNSTFAKIHLKADNDGTPVAGDTAGFYLYQCCGDPDGQGPDELVNSVLPLDTLDTMADDPRSNVVDCPISKKGQLIVGNNSATNSITVSACIFERVWY